MQVHARLHNGRSDLFLGHGHLCSAARLYRLLCLSVTVPPALLHCSLKPAPWEAWPLQRLSASTIQPAAPYQRLCCSASKRLYLLTPLPCCQVPWPYLQHTTWSPLLLISTLQHSRSQCKASDRCKPGGSCEDMCCIRQHQWQGNAAASLEHTTHQCMRCGRLAW